MSTDLSRFDGYLPREVRRAIRNEQVVGFRTANRIKTAGAVGHVG